MLAELVVPFSNSKISNHSVLQISGKMVTSNTWPLCAAAFSEQFCVCRRVARVQPGHGSVHSAASQCAAPGGVAARAAALGASPVTCVGAGWALRGAGGERAAFQGALPRQGSGNDGLMLSWDTGLVEEP